MLGIRVADMMSAQQVPLKVVHTLMITSYHLGNRNSDQARLWLWFSHSGSVCTACARAELEAYREVLHLLCVHLASRLEFVTQAGIGINED